MFSFSAGAEASTNGHQIELPVTGRETRSPFFDSFPGQLFRALEVELDKSESRLLTALWFLQQSRFRSAFRSSFSEDIQNLCTAFEALLNINDKGDSAAQVARSLLNLFRDQAPSDVESAAGLPVSEERQEVLDELWQWTRKLYEIRNAYTHGKTVMDFFYNRRSVWQDAFEVFLLSANRIILNRPERRPTNGSMIEKRLMSVRYFDEVVALLWDRDKWFPDGKKLGSGGITLDDAIRKGRALDPGLVETINSLGHLHQALFNICTFVCHTLEQLKENECDGRNVEAMLKEFREAYSSCSTPKLDTNAYIRKIAPRLTMWVPALPIQGSNALLYELIDAFKHLLFIYGQQTEPVLNSLERILP